MQPPNRLVICEDNEMICRLLEQVFDQDGRTVVVTSTTAACREACRTGSTDVLVTDLMLKGENALGLIRKLRAEQPEIRIIALTGGGDSWVEAAIAHGAHYVLEKPTDMETLLQAVDCCYQKRR